MGAGCSSGVNGTVAQCSGDERIDLKIVLIGEAETGKSSILLRYVKNQFKCTYQPTEKVVIENVVKKVNRPGDVVMSLSLWDIPSREDINLRSTYYANVHAAVVVVDVTSKESIELAGWWKQDFVNQVNKTRLVTSKLDTGQEETIVEEEACEGHSIPVLLLGNKYDLIEEKLQAEYLQKLTTPEQSPDNESSQNDKTPDDTVGEMAPRHKKPECVNLLEQVEEQHGFIGSVVVSAKNEDFSVHSAMQSFLRHLLEDSVTRKILKASQKPTSLRMEKTEDDVLQKTGIDEVDALFERCHVPIRRSRDYATYYELVLKSFKQQCAEMGYLTESKASLEDAIIAIRDAVKSSTGLQLKTQISDTFLLLIHGAENDEDIKIPREITKLMTVFNNEYVAVCKAILRDCPVMNATLSKLDSKLANQTVDATSFVPNGHADRHITTLNAICERNRARIACSIKENEESVRLVDEARRRIHVAILW